MKAGEDLTIRLDKKSGAIVPYKSRTPTDGLKFIVIKKGEDIPTKLLKRYIDRNLEKIGDVKYVDKRPINLPKDLYAPPVVSTTMKIKRRKYTQDSLNEIYNEKGFSALKEIGREFDPIVKDNSSRRIIVEILKAQEERQRAGL